MLLLNFALNPHTQAQPARPSGSLVCWGQQFIPYVDPGTRFTGVAAGDHFTVALTRDGAVVAWGLNHQYRQAETPVAASSDVVTVAAGTSHTVALKRDGTVVAWGNNFAGQVTGTPTTTGLGYATGAPVRLGGGVLSGVTAVAAGSGHSVALTTNGTLVAWGDNFAGQVTGIPTTPTTTGQANATAAPVRLAVRS